MFLTKTREPNNTLKRALNDAEKLEFVSKSVSWIQGKDIMDSCFILNFGYEASLPWPQVDISLLSSYCWDCDWGWEMGMERFPRSQ